MQWTSAEHSLLGVQHQMRRCWIAAHAFGDGVTVGGHDGSLPSSALIRSRIACGIFRLGSSALGGFGSILPQGYSLATCSSTTPTDFTSTVCSHPRLYQSVMSSIVSSIVCTI